jgi:hypothetical protein
LHRNRPEMADFALILRSNNQLTHRFGRDNA